jgi:hypothetical protein
MSSDVLESEFLFSAVISSLKKTTVERSAMAHKIPTVRKN